MEKKNKMNIILFALLTATFFMSGVFFNLGEFHVGCQYIGMAAIILVGGFVFLASPDIPAFLESVRFSGILMLQGFICLVFTMLIYLFQMTGIRQMISGFFGCIYLFIEVITAGVIVYLLKEKAVGCLFWAIVLVFLLKAAGQMRLVGTEEFFRQLYTLIASFAKETGSAMSVLEQLGINHSFALCLIYFYCFRDRDGKVRFWMRAAAAVLCMVIGLKRGVVLALFVALALCMVNRLIPAGFQKPFVNLIIMGLLAYSFLIIPIIRYRVLEEAGAFFQVDAKGRFDIYNIYANYYEISPLFGGRGLGWVDNFLRDGAENMFGYRTPTGVHDEYVRSYIELGFWGYLFWILSVFPWILKKMTRVENRDGSAAVVGCVMLMAIAYTFSNIYFNSTTNIVYATVLTAAAKGHAGGGRGKTAGKEKGLP